MKFEQNLMSMLNQDANDGHRAGSSHTIMAKDYELDTRLDHDEINHKLTFVGGTKHNNNGIDYAALFPPSTAQSNYQKLLELKLNEQRD